MGALGFGVRRGGRRFSFAMPPVAPPVALRAVQPDGWQAISGENPVAPMALAVRRQGFDGAGQPVLHDAMLHLTTPVRRPWPDQATMAAERAVLSDYVYASDSIAGAANDSTERSPKPIAAWALPHRLIVADAIEWEIVAFHRNAQHGRQVACVQVQASDGTTVTPWHTVAQTALSTLCEDANPVEVYRGVVDVSGLADGLVTLRARVLPWVGGDDAVLDSADAGNPMRFANRYYRKDPARHAAPPLAYVASSGSDATGVVSSDPAAAAAAPCLTIGGALVRARAALGNGQGAIDGLRIRVVDGVSFGSAFIGTNNAQDIAAVVVERAPGTSRAAAVATLSSSFRPSFLTHTAPLTEGALIFRDMTFARTASSIAGEAGSLLDIQFWNVAMALGGVTGAFVAATAALSLSGVQVSGWNSNRPSNQRFLRGVTLNLTGGSNRGLDATGPIIGCTLTGLSGLNHNDPGAGLLIYGNRIFDPASSAPVLTFQAAAAGQDMGGIAIVQNLVETTHATSATAALFVAADGNLGNVTHAVVMHNTLTGYGLAGRSNLWYDESAAPRVHRLMREVGNLHSQLNTKGDVFRNDGTRLGQFAYSHGVGCEGNFSMFRSASTTPLSFEQGYAGIGSRLGTSQTERHDPLFLDYRGTTGADGVAASGAGGGDYRLRPDSPARGIVGTRVLAFDLAGQPRGTGVQAAGAYA